MGDPYTIIPLTRLRKVIGARMSEAARTIPHYRLIVDAEVDALLRLRQQLNAELPERRVTVNDCLIKACAFALMEHPAVNSQFVNQALHQYCDADISVIMAVEGGLATPVIRGANQKTVHEIAAAVKDLAGRAGAGQLRMEEILGGSFSISNLGGYGIEQFDAIINPPQCAILAVGQVAPRVTVSDGE